MKNKIILCFGFLPFGLLCQNDTLPYTLYKNKVVLYSDIGYTSAPFSMHYNYNNTVDKLKYKNNFRTILGFGICYKWFALRIGIPLPGYFKPVSSFGKTIPLDLGFDFTIKKTFFDIDIRSYRGYAILDAYKYIFDYAESVGKPAVINLSWGMHTGPHDGTSLFDIATESLVGKGKVLVGANGNEGDNNMHWNYQFNHDTASTIMIENNRQWRQRESVYSDFWGSKNSSFAIQIEFIDTNKKTIAKSPFISSLSNNVSVFKYVSDSSIFKVAFVCQAKNPLNQKPNITVMADHQNQRKYAIIAHLVSDSSLVHAWNSGATREWTSGSFTNKLNKLDFSSSFINGNTNYTAGENGGSSKAVISVGALAARSAFRNVKGVWVNDSGYVVPVNITRFSSKGPSVDGRIKPNISAPGFDVPSAVNNKQFGGWMLDKTLLKTVFRNDTQYWSAFNGTSMAAPHVTGIVALILQANPNLTAAQVKTIIESTATVDQNTGSVPNNSYGYGKVNAYNAVLMALQYAGINALNKGSNLTVYPNPFQDELNVVLPAITNSSRIELISIDGKLIKSIDLDARSPQELSIQTPDLEKGFYILKFTNGGEIFILKLVKN